MSIYLRPKVPGASVFFTVNLMTRGSRLLLDEIDRLRAAVRTTHAERPFQIDALLVLPDHLHAVWTLPPGGCGLFDTLGRDQFAVHHEFEQRTP